MVNVHRKDSLDLAVIRAGELPVGVRKPDRIKPVLGLRITALNMHMARFLTVVHVEAKSIPFGIAEPDGWHRSAALLSDASNGIIYRIGNITTGMFGPCADLHREVAGLPSAEA